MNNLFNKIIKPTLVGSVVVIPIVLAIGAFVVFQPVSLYVAAIVSMVVLVIIIISFMAGTEILDSLKRKGQERIDD